MAVRTVDKEGNPWYREPWPWILLGLPATAVLAGVVTLIIAITHRDGLVAEDYYKEGLAINRVLEREARASELGLKAQVMVSNEQIRVRVVGAEVFPDRVVTRFIHPTRAGEDREVELAAISAGWYEGRLPKLATGRWYLYIEDADATWRLKGSWMTGQPSVQMAAARTS